MELAARFLERAGEAVDRLDEANIIAARNAMIRAHKELIGSPRDVSQPQRGRCDPKRKPHVDQLPLTWQPQVGDRVTLGSETIYTVTPELSQNGSDVDLQTLGPTFIVIGFQTETSEARRSCSWGQAQSAGKDRRVGVAKYAV